MATTSKNLKTFYRQKKNTISGRISKSKSSSSKKTSPSHAATLGSDLVQPAALISHGSPDLQDGYDQREEVLRQFDMNMAFGPCLGLTRLARWERAQRLGLAPPKEVKDLLGVDQIRQECLWDGIV